MNGKIFTVVLVALCAAQVFSAPPEPRAIEDVINNIKEIVKKIETAIADIVRNIPIFIKNLEDKIQEIIDKIVVGGIFGKSQEKIGEAAKKCIDAKEFDVNQMITDVKDYIAKCEKIADDRTDQLVSEVEELKTKAYKLIEEINKEVQKCFNEHGVNLIKLVTCMTDHLADINTKADALIQQIVDTVAAVNKTADDISGALEKCTTQISVDFISKEKQINENFQKCVDEVKKQQ